MSLPIAASTQPVALITGGSTGIGAACARRFLAAGWRVSTVALPDAGIDWLKPLAVVVEGDITDPRVREAIVERTLSSYGRIDALINNAGVGLYGYPTQVSPALFSRMLDVNVVAPLALAQAVLPVMRSQGKGSLVTIGSVAAGVALPWASAYSASKAALDSLHDSLRRELRGTPIHLLKVNPGIVDTDFRNHVLAGAAPPSVQDIRRVISPDDLAEAIFRAVRRRRQTLYMPAIGSLFHLMGALAPAAMDVYLGRYLSSKDSPQKSVAAGAGSGTGNDGITAG